MNKKLVLVEDSTEDLLTIIDQIEEQSGEEQLLGIQQNKTYVFLQRFKLRAGKNKIARKDLYTLYSKSSFQPTTNKKFYKELEALIPVEKGFALINKNLDNLVAEIKPEVKKTDTISSYLMRRFENFLKEHNIIDGTDIYISDKALYYFFDKWAYNKKTQVMWFNKFKRLTSLYLKNKKRLTNEISYGMDKQFYDNISTEEISKAKDWAKKYKPTNQD